MQPNCDLLRSSHGQGVRIVSYAGTFAHPPEPARLRYPVSILVIKASEHYCCNRHVIRFRTLVSSPTLSPVSQRGRAEDIRRQNRNSKYGSGIQQKRLCGWPKTLCFPFQTLRYIRFQNLFPTRYCFRRISKRICRHSHHRCILIQLLHINLIKSVCGRMMIVKVEPRILRGRETGNA